jgi:pyrimidine-nucleoside phosphorylase
MRAVDIIANKRDARSLSSDEIRWFIDAYTRGDLPDYQAAAFLMAVCIRGMTAEETTELTLAMARSGDELDLSDVIEYAVDKHSSGGVGDKTSLAVLPLVASCGVPVAKMSGRGLGYTGGTLDKIEAIAGFSSNLTEDDFRRLVRETGLVLGAQTRVLAPADGKLYALRDVTATVASLPLIASSIMSKKLAAGANGIVLDVKTGSGAFMTTLDEARNLAQLMVEIGVRAGRDMVALVSDMNQPLGRAVGHALEVREAIDTLNGGGPEDFREHCLVVASHMLRLAGQGQQWRTVDEARADLEINLASGAALAKLRQMVVAQGGDGAYVDEPDRLPQASIVEPYKASTSGFVAQVDANTIARAAFTLGGGREKKGDAIDLAVGVVVDANVGDAVEAGDTVFTIHANDSRRAAACRALLDKALEISTDMVEPLPLFYDTIYGDEHA